MKFQLPRILATGILGGAVVGSLVGAYVVFLTSDFVIDRGDYADPVTFEVIQSRYGAVVLSSFVATFIFIGPFVAAASFGPWIRHAVYGLVGGIGLVVAVALTAAALGNEQPFNMHKGSHSTCIDVARIYALPVALVIGPVMGMLFGRRRPDA